MRLEDLVGRTIGRYHITALVGRGGMAAVYQARDAALQRDVALKVLYPQYADDPLLVERFQREAWIAARLDHPNIVPIYDVATIDGLTCIAMKLLDRKSLADLLSERGQLSLAELLPVISQIASALDFSYQRFGIVHRDLKPGNVLFSGGLGGAALLADFGIAKALDAPSTTRTGMLLGTPDYMAPEQIRGGPVDARTDVYALGGLVYRSLTSRRPFEGTTQEVLIGHLEGTPPAPALVDPSVPPAVSDTIARAMARAPDDRFASAGAFASALYIAAGLPAPEAPIYAPGPPLLPPDNLPPLAPQYASDAATIRGAAFPNLPASSDRTTMGAGDPIESFTPDQPASERRRPPILAALAALAVIISLLAGAMLFASSRVTAVVPTPVPSIAPLPSVSPPQPTAAPTVEATAAPTVPPTVAATTVATTMPITATAEPSITATRTPRPSASRTPRPSIAPSVVPSAPPAPPTLPPSLTPAPSNTPTVTATPCPVELRGGFARLFRANPALQTQLGCPTRQEQTSDAREQTFERGSMYFFNAGRRVYVLIGTSDGRWAEYSPADYGGQPTPTPAPPRTDGLLAPISDFGLVWNNERSVRDGLGYAVEPEVGPLDGLRQPFERGVMIFSPLGAGNGRTIYVLGEDRTYVRYDEPAK